MIVLMLLYMVLQLVKFFMQKLQVRDVVIQVIIESIEFGVMKWKCCLIFGIRQQNSVIVSISRNIVRGQCSQVQSVIRYCFRLIRLVIQVIICGLVIIRLVVISNNRVMLRVQRIDREKCFYIGWFFFMLQVVLSVIIIEWMFVEEVYSVIVILIDSRLFFCCCNWLIIGLI